jgi:hypothetical protein
MPCAAFVSAGTAISADTTTSHPHPRPPVRHTGAAIQTQLTLAGLNFGQAAIFSCGLGAAMMLAAREAALGNMTVGDVVMVRALLLSPSHPSLPILSHPSPAQRSPSHRIPSRPIPSHPIPSQVHGLVFQLTVPLGILGHVRPHRDLAAPRLSHSTSLDAT